MSSSPIRKDKPKPTELQMPRFLYSILKQKDLKTIDWGKVAEEQGIPSAHAARMRYSRFRDAMEGKTTSRRTRNPGTPKKSHATKESPASPVASSRSSIDSRMNIDAITAVTEPAMFSESIYAHHPHSQPHPHAVPGAPYIKSEPGAPTGRPPLTPASPCPSPDLFPRHVTPVSAAAAGVSDMYSMNMMEGTSPRFSSAHTSFSSSMVDGYNRVDREFYAPLMSDMLSGSGVDSGDGHDEYGQRHVHPDYSLMEMNTSTLGFKQEKDA